MIVVPKMNSNPIVDDGNIIVVINKRKMINNWKSGPHYYTSEEGGIITLMLTPNSKHQFLTKLR